MIKILDSGMVEYKDIARKWRTTFQPGEWDEATKYLNDSELFKVQAAWTPEVIKKWKDDHPEPKPRGPRPPSLESRIATLEAAIARLETTLTKLRL